LALYWAEALATQTKDETLKTRFAPIAKSLLENEEKILNELEAAQGCPVDIGGYYWPDENKVFREMRPSHTFNNILASIS
jgi:isocitrate dehydrogenase